MNEEYNGIAEDPRSEEEKKSDYKFEELFTAVEPKWEEREPKKYPIFNQDGSGSCVSFALAKVLGIDEEYEGREFTSLSPRDIYVRRQNKDTMGMWFPNAFQIAKTHGDTLESLVPSQNKGESLMNSWEDINEETDRIALKYRSNGYMELPLDIDAIASIIHTGKAVLMGFRFDYDEWTDFPTVNPNSQRKCGHGVACVDAVLKDGKKYLVIDDSWGPQHAKFGQRYISEEFLKARGFYAGYTLNLQFNPQEDKPKHTFNYSMHWGDKNEEVKWLQVCLQYLGYFPKTTNFTGNFYGITLNAVKKFQKHQGLVVDGWVGKNTRAALNRIFGV